MKGFKIITVLFLCTIVSISFSMEINEILVNVMFYETDLREAINEISIQTGVNIIYDQTVGGVVTADIRDMPLEKALNMILISGGYTFREMDGFYLVGLPDPKNITFSDLSTLEVIELENIMVEEVFDLLPSFLSTYVKGDRQNNLITINAAPKETKRIKEFIERIDRPKKQIEVRLLVTEVDTKVAQELGINLFEYNTNEKNKENFVYNGRESLIEIEADIYGSLLAKLKALAEEQKASIEADPYIIVSDGGTANLFIGEEQVLLIKNDENYSNTRTEEVKVGIGLEVSARIMGNEQIYLELAPIISHFVDEVRPDILVRENSMSTSLQIGNGQTVCLAGMTLNNDSESTRKVPVLGDIPLLRWLFRSESKEENQKELLVFVTPVIK